MATRNVGVLLLLVFYYVLTVIFAEEEKNNVTQTVIKIGGTSMTLSFNPAEIERLVMGNRDNVYVSSNLDKMDTGVKGANQDNVVSLKAQSADDSIARVKDDTMIQIPLGSNFDQNLNETFFTVEGSFLGRTHLNFYAKAKDGKLITYTQGNGKSSDPNDPWAPPIRNHTGAVSTQIYMDIPTTDNQNLADDWQKLDIRYKVAVIREDRALDRIFLVTIIVLLLIAKVGMGCKIDLNVVKEVLRRPIAPTIGFCCQFIVMPLVRIFNPFNNLQLLWLLKYFLMVLTLFCLKLAFGICMLLKLETGVALGFFAMGCAPGGGASNIYTYLLNGDLSLSITMTLISTFASLGRILKFLFSKLYVYMQVWFEI